MGYTYDMSKSKRIFGRPPAGEERGGPSPQRSIRFPRESEEIIEKAAKKAGVRFATFVREAAEKEAARINGKR